MHLSASDIAMLAGIHGEGPAVAMRILVETARLLGAQELIEVASAHIDGCLYHGDSGVLFAEMLVLKAAKVCIHTTLNVGALDLLHGRRSLLAPAARDMALRMMKAYVAMGCQPTWTCAPYQAGHRPRLGTDVAWGESNAVVFCNSVLGARSNRYGDFLDICAALTGRAPRSGLHIPSNRRATVLVDVTKLPRAFFEQDIAYPILGAWLGREAGAAIVAFDGMPGASEDQLKALGAAAASSGAVGLFHVIGVTPEAATREIAFAGYEPETSIAPTADMLSEARASLSTVMLSIGDRIDAVAIGSPHLSVTEIQMLDEMLGTRQCKVPLYACTSRYTLSLFGADGTTERLQVRGVELIADTCIVVTPILPPGGGVLMTNSGKFAHYTPSNTGYEVVFASLEDCIDSAVAGHMQLRPVV